MTNTAELTLEEIHTARTAVIRRRPYLAALLMSLRFVKVDTLNTVGISSDLQLFWGPKAGLRELHGEVLQGALIHEAMHILTDTIPKSQRIQKFEAGKVLFDPVRYNKAADCEINDDLALEEEKLPTWALYPSSYGLANYNTAEYYYESIQTDAGGPCGCFSINGGDTLPDMTTPKGKHEKIEEIIETTKDIIKSIGSSNETTRHILRSNRGKKTTINWRRALSYLVRHHIARTQGMVDYTMSRPSHRSICTKGFILPSLYKPTPLINVVLDVSDSMEGPPSDISITAIQEIIHAIGVDGITIFATNTQVKDVLYIRRGDLREICFGGGTDLNPGIQEAAEKKGDIIVIITDCETRWPLAPPDPSKTYVVVGVAVEPYWDAAIPKWCKTVYIPKEDLLEKT